MNPLLPDRDLLIGCEGNATRIGPRRPAAASPSLGLKPDRWQKGKRPPPWRRPRGDGLGKDCKTGDALVAGGSAAPQLIPPRTTSSSHGPAHRLPSPPPPPPP